MYARTAGRLGIDPAALLFEEDERKNIVRIATAAILSEDERKANAAANTRQ